MIVTSSSDMFIQFRQELHRYPDVSGQEVETQQRIKTFVQQFNPVFIREVGGTGLLLQYGTDTTGPVTMIRADTDALPIQEFNTFGHQSTKPNVSHKCGHDGHTTILARVASLLTGKPLKGRVYLLFQPAEETGQGAQAVLNDPLFDIIPPGQVTPDRVTPDRVTPDRVFALHNLPGFEQGVIVCKPGPFTASVLSMIVTFTGKVSHSAEPEKGLNPAYVMADFLLKSKLLQQPDPRSDAFALVTPIYTTMGEKSYGVSAGYGEVHVTLRTRSASQMETLNQQLLALLTELSRESGVDIATSYTEAFFANENDPTAFLQIKESAHKLGYRFIEAREPFKWGEDFGLFTQRYKGAMFGIGAGETSPALHNADYDFNDELIEPAARLFLELITLAHY